ncbi:MAG: antitoxin [Actinomycetota bacterium]|nr:antitoxin [Actinomycetota bacterium]
MGFLDKVKDLASKNADKVDMAIEKVGDVVDMQTGQKYKDTVDKVQQAAKKAVAENAPAEQPPASPPAPPAGPPPTS